MIEREREGMNEGERTEKKFRVWTQRNSKIRKVGKLIEILIQTEIEKWIGRDKK